MYEKKNWKGRFSGGGGVSFISYFSIDKTLEIGYDIDLSYAMIADDVTLLTIFLFNFWTAGFQFCKK